MKNLVAILVMIFAVQYTYAQPLEGEDLLNLVACDDYNCMLEKTELLGYEVASNKERDGYKVYGFKSELTYQNESNQNVIRPYMVQYAQRPGDSSIAVNYTVGSKTERKQLLQDFKLKGFDYVKATKTESIYDNAATVYKSDEHPDLWLKVTNFEKEEQGRKFMEYDFELLRMTKAPKDNKKKNPLSAK